MQTIMYPPLLCLSFLNHPDHEARRNSREYPENSSWNVRHGNCGFRGVVSVFNFRAHTRFKRKHGQAGIVQAATIVGSIEIGTNRAHNGIIAVRMCGCHGEISFTAIGIDSLVCALQKRMRWKYHFPVSPR